MLSPELRRNAAQEAVDYLGLLKPQAVNSIENLLSDATSVHPAAICTAYRKNSPQISDEAKKSLGIRKNGFLSSQAFAELSEIGLKNPLRAHELTVLRASFVLLRYCSVQSSLEISTKIGSAFIGFLFDASVDACKSCRGRDGEIVVDPMSAIFPHSDCSCVTANYGIRAHIDWLAGDDHALVKSEHVQQSTSAVVCRNLLFNKQPQIFKIIRKLLLRWIERFILFPSIIIITLSNMNQA